MKKHIEIMSLTQKSVKPVLDFRFFWVATFCFDDSFAHSLSQLHEAASYVPLHSFDVFSINPQHDVEKQRKTTEWEEVGPNLWLVFHLKALKSVDHS